MKLLHEALARAADRHADRVALQSAEQTLSFEDFALRVERLAGGLAYSGIRHGDRVAILAPNCADYLAYHYATARLGAILLVLNIRHTKSEWRHVLRDAEACTIVLHADFTGHLESLRSGSSTIRLALEIDRLGGFSRDHQVDVDEGFDHTTHDLVEGALPLLEQPRVHPTDPALLIYTSGTTGRPKGALQTHQGSTTIDELTARCFEATERDVYLAFMPYFHQAGLIRSRAVLTRGGRSLYHERKVGAGLSPERLAQTLRDHAVTITMLVPPYDTRLAEIANDEELDFPQLRLIVGAGGAGRRHAARMESFCERFGCEYIGVYGQTEVTGPATIVAGPDYFSDPSTCGRALDGIDLEIWGEEERPLPAGEIGEIMIRGETCIPGYWQNDEASKALYSGDWLHTGDLAHLDERGFLHFVDRKKELIKTGGENVYPSEVEIVLRQHPSITDVAVLGLPDPDGWGERVAAAIVLRGKEVPTSKELRAYCRDRLAGYKIPKTVICVDEIPRNLTGKPLKRELRKRFAAENDPT